jgi:LasA protease
MRRILPILCLLALVSACTRTAPVSQGLITPVAPLANPQLPTSAPVQTYLPPTRAPGTPISSPTPDVPEILPTFTPIPLGTSLLGGDTPTPGPLTYTVQSGDYPASIAEQFGITADELLTANNLTADTIIYPGDVLQIPVSGSNPQPTPVTEPASAGLASSDFFKVIPDSELVYGPLSAMLPLETFIQQQGGYLAYYTQDVNGETLTGAQIVQRVAQSYSVNPRLLLAVLEYRAQWVTNPNPAASTYEAPIGYVDDFYVGLYRQLVWSAIRLNEGFYGWKAGKVQNWTLSDKTSVVPQPGINPGTAGVQNLFAYLDDNPTWQTDVGPTGLFATFSKMFGYPFDWAIEPFLPAGLTQPTLALPFGPGENWHFTGGPHAGWDVGSAWAALDFVPPGNEPIGCGATDAWVTAVADGLILRAKNGAVIEDLDGDGLEQTGWTILYMHIETRDQVETGKFVHTGDRIGHPSCEGGEANATHLHIARRYNGMWIAADDPQLPFVMDGYVTTGNGTEYDGWLTKNGQQIEAVEAFTTVNEIQH